MRLGLLTTVFVQLGNIAYGLVLPRVLILNYGSEVNGLVAGALQIVSLIALLEAGLSTASIRQLYAPLAERDSSMVGRVLGSVRHYFLRVAGWGALVGAGAGVAYALVMESAQTFTVVVLITWLVIAGPVMDFALNSKFYVFFVASQRVSKFQLSQLAATTYRFVVVVVCGHFGTDVLILLFFLSLGALLKWLILLLFFRFEPFRFDYSRPLVPVEQRGSVFGHQLLGAVVYSGPLLYIGAFVGAAAASVFSINSMVFGIAYGFLAMLMGQVVVARLGHHFARGELLEVSSFMGKISLVVVGMAFVMMAASVILLPSFFGLYLGKLGDSYRLEVETALFALWGFFNMVKIPNQTVINAAGKFRDTLWISFVEMSVFFGILLIGFQHASIMLVLGAMLFSVLLKVLLLALFVHRRIVRQAPAVVSAGGVSAVALLAVCLGLAPSVAASSIFEWLYRAVLVVLLLAIVAVGLVLGSWGIGRALRPLRRS